MRSKTTAAVQAVIVLLGIFSAQMAHADCDDFTFGGACNIGLDGDESRQQFQNGFFNQRVGVVQINDQDLPGLRTAVACLRFNAAFCQVDPADPNIGTVRQVEEVLNIDANGRLYARRNGRNVAAAADVEGQLAAEYLSVNPDPNTQRQQRTRLFLRRVMNQNGGLGLAGNQLLLNQNAALRNNPFGGRAAGVFGGGFGAGYGVPNYNFGQPVVASTANPFAQVKAASVAPTTAGTHGMPVIGGGAPQTHQRDTATTEDSELVEHNKEFAAAMVPKLDEISETSEKHKCYGSADPNKAKALDVIVSKKGGEVALKLGALDPVLMSFEGKKVAGQVGGPLVKAELRWVPGEGGAKAKYILQVITTSVLGEPVDTLVCETMGPQAAPTAFKAPKRSIIAPKLQRS